ncbi:MAG TPA: hypothetical protein DEQ14_08155 [Treponema sp.]|nr:hypothetical protein [Treponema sp.]
MKKKALGFLLILFFPLYAAAVGINFQGLDLSDDNRLLFCADSGTTGGGGQRSVFVSRLTDLALQQITVFPEEIDIVEDGRSLLVRNVFGAALVPLSGGLPRPLAGFPSFVTGNVPVSGGAESLAVSRDGRWLLRLEYVSHAYGNLILVELSTGNRRTISTRIERSIRNFPARWSPDSRVFVYCKGGKLYYYPLFIESDVDERYRQIGEGKISAVAWGDRGDFFYIKGSAVYRVGGQELFTHAVYADFLEVGQTAGRLPLEFDPDFDLFWMSPDSRALVFSKGGRNVFYYPLSAEVSANETLPYIKLPAGAFDIDVLWPSPGALTVTASVRHRDGIAALAWRFAADGSQASRFTSLETPVGSHYALSPDGSKVLAWGEKGSVLLDYNTWKPARSAQPGPVHSCVWLGNNEYIVADSSRIERVDLAGRRRLVCLSGALEYGFEESEKEGNAPARILAKSGGAWYVTDGVSPWAAITEPRVRQTSHVSGRYRVYLEKQSGFPYENIPMIRNTASVGTTALLPLPFFREASVPEDSAQNGQDGVFNHGSRAGHRDIALCFDLYDDDSGLAQALEALSRFGVRATFFLNGDFIRRHPDSTRAIAESGHEAASMFYAPVDLSSSRYVFSGDYIAEGLARNEDEYYAASGGELSLLWHPPFFRFSREIVGAASRAGYQTIGRDVDPMDWISRDEALKLGISRESVPEMIERIMETKKPGSIIPIRLGQQPGGNDYLFLNIEVLLDSLIRSGYSVVPVSALVQRGL